jgi:hypothetical protein
MTKSFCAAPWRGLHIQVDGGLKFRSCFLDKIKITLIIAI